MHGRTKMNYFITDMLGYNPTGIENAQLLRMRLFHKHQVPAKIITTNYNRFLDLNCFRAGVDISDVFNVSNYYQDALSFDGEPTTLTSWSVNGLGTPVKKGPVYYYYQGQYLAARVTLFNADSNYPFAPDQIDKVDYYDQQNNISYTDFYDVRGFKSMTWQYGHQAGVSSEQFWAPDGRLMYEGAYTNENGNNILSRIAVYHGDSTQVFDNRDELISAAFHELNVAEPNVVFYSDRPTAADKPLFMRPADEFKIFCVRHSAHTYDRNDPMHSKFNDVVQNEINYQSHIRGFITATDRQRDDIKNRTGIEAWTAPVGYNTNAELQRTTVPLTERAPLIITASRVHPEKQLDQLISAFTGVHKHIPDAKLAIFGAITDQNYYRKLQKQIATARLENYVSFNGYSESLFSEFDRARVYVTTGKYEAFNISVQQALAAGLPAVGYDVHYGIREQISDHENGNLVKLNDVVALQQAITKIIRDDALWQQMSTNAKKLSQRYSEDMVWQNWQQILQVK